MYTVHTLKAALKN